MLKKLLPLINEPVHSKGRLRSACISAQSNQSLCCSHVPSTASGYPKRDKLEPLHTGGCTG